MIDSRRQRTVRQSAICHYALIFVSLLLLHSLIWSLSYTKDRHPNPAGSPAQKATYYEVHSEEFDLLFVGDSRTYCGLHPDEIDPLLGTRSLNLSSFAHWLPTQYPAFQKLVPRVPPHTTVVWSIGLGNFHGAGDGKIQNSHPVGLMNVPRYLGWGYSWKEIQPNVNYFATHDWPGRALAKIQSLESRPLLQSGAIPATGETFAEATADETAAVWQRLQAECVSDPSLATVEVVRDPQTNAVTSLAAITNRGAYRRYEIVPAFFRRQQQRSARKLRDQPSLINAPIVADDAYWSTFVATLELFRSHDVDLVVNEIPDAPYVYNYSPTADAYRRFLRGQVRAAVEESGFVWISADVEQLGDEDYFDYNHLNSQGIKKYARCVAVALKPHLDVRGTDK